MDNDTIKLWELLGTMKSDIGHIRQSVDVMQEHTGRINDTMIKQEMRISAAHQRLDTLEPVVTNVKNWKISVLAVSTTLSGLMVGGLALIKAFLSVGKGIG